MGGGIAGAGNHTSPGCGGPRLLLDGEVAHGQGVVASEMLRKDDQPSFGYMISQGATTLWENWQGRLPQGAVGSNNHVSANPTPESSTTAT